MTTHQQTFKVLSGLHAGAELSLENGSYRIGDAQLGVDATHMTERQSIELMDWRGPAVYADVEHRPDGTAFVRLRDEDTLPSESNSPSPTETEWAQMEPRRLGGIAVCFGASNAGWPSDAALVRQLDQGSAEIADDKDLVAPIQFHFPQQRSARAQARGGIAAITAMVGAGLMLGAAPLFGRVDHDLAEAAPAPQSSPRAPPKAVSANANANAGTSNSNSTGAAASTTATAATAAAMREVLKTQGFVGLSVQEARDGLVVVGLVRDSQENELALEALRPFAPSRPRAAWDIVDELIATIDAALRAPGASTRYAGAGRFITEGTADSPARVSATARQLRRDLGANLKELEVVVTAQAGAPRFSSALVAGRIKYDDRRDGTRRFEADAP